MRTALKLLSSARLALLLATIHISVSLAADLGPAASATTQPAAMSLRDALSRYLSLEMIRATFDVAERDDLGALLEDEALAWGKSVPSAEAMADLDQQLLAEASYYIVSLSYLVQAGGAVFPGDKSEPVYTNDTISRLDTLRRDLFAAIDDGGDVLPILTEVEQVRALTEGYTEVPENLGVFTTHEALLDDVLKKLESGTPT